MSKKTIIKEKEILPLGETVYSFNISCGLGVEIVRKKNFVKKYAAFSVKYGSDDICFTRAGDIAKTVLPYGTAHFLEHKLFEQKKKNAMEEFSSLGVSSNAGTGHVRTTYYFNCTENFEKSLRLLMSFVKDPYITDENVEKEKGIIAQEIKMYDDSPENRCFVNMMKALYKSNYARYDIAGSCEDIKRIDKDVLMKAYETFYTPENAHLVIVGDVDPERVAEILESSDIKFKGSGIPVRIFPKEQAEPFEERISCKMSASKKMFCIGWKADESKFSGEKGILRTVAADLAAEIIAGVSSDFYNRIYDKGLVNKSFCFSPCIYRTHALTVCEGEADEPEKVLKEIGDEIAERIERGIGEAEFAREKNAYIGNLVKVCNNPAGLGSLLSSLYSMNTDLFDYFDCCAKIKCDDVKESFGILFSGRPVLSVVEPL